MKRGHNQTPGQSLVETALLLPILLIFFLGLIEVGLAMYNYITIAGANREAARLASRGRFPDETVAARVVSAGGLREISGVTEPHLRTTGADTNTGIIITRVTIPMDAGQAIQSTTYLSGTISAEGPSGTEMRPIEVSDGRLTTLTPDEYLAYLNYRRSVSAEIKAYRDSLDFEALDAETYVIVETFFTHSLLIGGMPYIPDPLTLYFASTLRVLDDSRID